MIRACYRASSPIGAGCDEATSITGLIEQGSTLPAFITRATNVITIASTDNANVKTYTMQVTVTTQFEDAPIVFNTVTIDLRVCVITDLDAPTAPTVGDATQLVFATTPKDITLASPGFVQRPACGYALVETFTWEIPSGAPITKTSDYVIRVETEVAAKRGEYDVKLINSAKYAGTGVTYANNTPFKVTVTDPCKTTVLTSVTVPNVSVQAGLTNEFSFIEVTDSAAIAVSKPTICGARTYTVYKIDGAGA